MKTLPLLLLAFAFSSTVVAQQVDDIYENLETRERFRIRGVIQPDILRLSFSQILNSRTKRLAELKKNLKAQCDEQFEIVKKRYEGNKQNTIEILESLIKSKEQYIKELGKSDTTNTVVKALIEDKRISIASDKCELATIDSAMESWGELKQMKQEYLKVDSIAKSQLKTQDAIYKRAVSQIKSGETYVMLSTDLLKDKAILEMYVPFSLIKNNRIYKKIN